MIFWHSLDCHAWKHPPTWCLRGIKQTIKRALGPDLDVITVMYSVESHDLFLALCHRTVPGAANPLFEEASPPPASELWRWAWAALLPLCCWKWAPCMCVCMLNVQVDFGVTTCTLRVNAFRASWHSYYQLEQNCSVCFILKSESSHHRSMTLRYFQPK